jgi:hypothetical protein
MSLGATWQSHAIQVGCASVRLPRYARNDIVLELKLFISPCTVYYLFQNDRHYYQYDSIVFGSFHYKSIKYQLKCNIKVTYNVRYKYGTHLAVCINDGCKI